MPDHAGHGASARLTAPFGVGDIADDVEALLASLGVDRLNIVGLSLGGMVALELALRHPARINSLVVANSFDKTTTPDFRTMAEGWATIFERPHGAIERLEQNWPSLVSPAFQSTPEGIRTYQVWHGVAATADGRSLAQVARGITTFDVSSRIAELAMPVLFIAGSLDRMSPPDMSRRMAGRAPYGQFSIIDGAAHISKWTRERNSRNASSIFYTQEIPNAFVLWRNAPRTRRTAQRSNNRLDSGITPSDLPLAGVGRKRHDHAQSVRGGALEVEYPLSDLGAILKPLLWKLYDRGLAHLLHHRPKMSEPAPSAIEQETGRTRA